MTKKRFLSDEKVAWCVAYSLSALLFVAPWLHQTLYPFFIWGLIIGGLGATAGIGVVISDRSSDRLRCYAERCALVIIGTGSTVFFIWEVLY